VPRATDVGWRSLGSNSYGTVLGERKVGSMLQRASFLCAVVLLGCGGDDDPDGGDDGSDGTGPVVITAEATPEFGSLSVAVLSGASGDPILDATVTIGDAAEHPVDVSGVVSSGSVRAGPVDVRVSANGYVPWRRIVGQTRGLVHLEVRMTPRADAATVSSDGATISVGNMQLEIPAGAFVSPTSVAATSLDAAAIVEGLGFVQFIDDSDTLHRIVAAIDIETEAEPALPVRLTVPTVDGVASERLLLWSLDQNNEWAEPVSPSATTDATVSFDVTHFSDFAVGIVEPADQGFVVMGATTDVLAAVPGGTAVRPTVGSVLPAGTTVTTRGGEASVVDPIGNTASLGADTTATLATCVTPDLCVRGGGQVTLDKGSTRWQSRPHSPGPLWRGMIRTRFYVSGGVRGTTLEVALTECPGGARALTEVLLYDGTVDLDPDWMTEGDESVMTGGDRAAVCFGCPPEEPPACGTCLGLPDDVIVATGMDPDAYGTQYSTSGGSQPVEPFICNIHAGLTVNGVGELISAGVLTRSETVQSFDPLLCRGDYTLSIEGVPNGAATNELQTIQASTSVRFYPDHTYTLTNHYYSRIDYTENGSVMWADCTVPFATGTWQAQNSH
jgi:hypothetical protein